MNKRAGSNGNDLRLNLEKALDRLMERVDKMLHVGGLALGSSAWTVSQPCSLLGWEQPR